MSGRKLKYLIKSKSFEFAKNLEDKSHCISSLNWNNTKVYYRACSSDMVLIYEILLKSKYKREYFFPEELKPKVIFDIGGNIGITSIYLASLFPDAVIYTFEPLKENFEILQKNTSQIKNIKVFNIGLGAENGSFKVYLSDDSENYGGVSFYSEVEGNLSESISECEVKNINDIIEELGINAVDLIKIDNRLFMFNAGKKEVISKLSKKEVKIL